MLYTKLREHYNYWNRYKMSYFSREQFPKYDQLSTFEKLFFRTCFYFPQRPSRMNTVVAVADTGKYYRVYERAFGDALWSLVEGKKVLDFGCGSGNYVLALAESDAAQVVGIDIRPIFELAEVEAKKRGFDKVSFIQGCSEELEDESFDVVISHDSFEHFEDPKAILNEMYRLTSREGIILIRFGPPWKNPWGRHMFKTIRKDRPWIHLIVPECTVMRCNSVYHDEPVLLERYSQRPGGLNQMTIKRFKNILKHQQGLRVNEFEIIPLCLLKVLTRFPVIREYFASGVKAICQRVM